MKPTPAACIFDMDGTLVDSLEDIADCANEALALHGYPTHSYDEYRYLVGHGAKALLVNSLPKGLTTERIAEVIPDMRRIYEAGWAKKTKPYGGMLETLTKLQSADIRLAVLSNKPHSMAAAMAPHFFPSIRFEEVRGLQPEAPAKPDPSEALGIAEKLGHEPASVCFIGDSLVDMQTAVNAGMIAVGVTWGFRDEKELIENGAAVIVHKPEELLGIFRL